jgi:hypothetical protein
MAISDKGSRIARANTELKAISLISPTESALEQVVSGKREPIIAQTGDTGRNTSPAQATIYSQ